MFDIRGDDIARLTDADLRTVVVRLAIAELAAQGSAVAAVTAGGHQDAPDGGLDVRVELDGALAAPDFVPRALTGFQVKRPDMPPSRIAEEMCPDGQLRPVIGALADAGGAYIIISAQGSVADGPLRQRRQAMREMLAGHPNAGGLAIDFYDRDRLAVWANQYPGVAAWVRRRIGGDISGWGPVGNWVDTGVAADGGYLTSEGLTLVDERTADHRILPVAQGLDVIRASLSRPGQAVRLIGLSGLGKTRLVQALFETGVGQTQLDPAISVYTDYGSDLRPSAREMARRLVEEGRRAILIVDNCNPATHSELAEVCGSQGSQVSLITVEYDIRDDEPERTEVFRLASGSTALVEQWLERDFEQVSQLDRRKIAEFSDGNFRIARALADTVVRGDNLGQLRNQDLFERIFQQRNAPDNQLMIHAQSLSLLYSFQGEDTEAGSELNHLAGIAGASADDLFASAANLSQRGIVQTRGRWRAVLPHALANPLAASALRRLAPARVDAFCLNLPPRMLKSLTRRLSYLHDSHEARALLGRWLAPGGRLATLSAVADFDIVQNLAPVDPSAMLRKIEDELAAPAGLEIVSTNNARRHYWVSLLRSLAYDPALFDRAAAAIVRFVAAEPADLNHNAAAPHWAEIFHIYLSGTGAQPAERQALVRELLADENADSRRAGKLALEALLKVSHFSSSFSFDFGARPRSFGWQPTLNAEIWDWYREAIQLALDFDSEEVRHILAENVRDLWAIPACHDILEAASQRFAGEGGWPEGWIGFRAALRFDGRAMLAEQRQRLEAIIAGLEPRSQIERARAYVLGRRGGIFDVADGVEDDPVAAMERASAEARRIGAGFAADHAALGDFLPEVIGAQFAPRAWEFGSGLAQAANDLQALWTEMVAHYRAADPGPRDATVLGGFISSAQALNPNVVSGLLEASIQDPALAPQLPYLQSRATVDDAGMARLSRAVEAGVVSALSFRHLANGVVRDMSDDALTGLLRRLAGVQDGPGIALDILFMRFYVSRGDGPEITAPLLEVGRELLNQFDYIDVHVMRDYGLAGVIREALAGRDVEQAAQRVCDALRETMDAHRVSAHDVDDVLEALFQTQPEIALDTFLLRGRPAASRRIFDSGFARAAPIEQLEAVTLQAWADRDPDVRYPLLGESVSLFPRRNFEEVNELSPLFLALLAAAPDKQRFLGEAWTRIHPRSWSGSLADILERRRGLIEGLRQDVAVAAWYEQVRPQLEAWIEEARRRDTLQEEGFE